MAPFLCSPVVAALRFCGAERQRLSKSFRPPFPKGGGFQRQSLWTPSADGGTPYASGAFGGSGGILQEKIPPGPPFFAPSLRLWPPRGGGGAKRRWGPYLAGGAFSPGEGLPRLSANVFPFRGGGPFLSPMTSPTGGGGPEGRRGDDRFLGLLPPPLSRCGGSSPHGGAGAGRGGGLFYREVPADATPQPPGGGSSSCKGSLCLPPPRCAHPGAPRRGGV